MGNGSFSQAGFYYQNNLAALKLLDLLEITNEPFVVNLENPGKGKHIDDIIITKKDIVQFYQVKWSEEVTNSFTINNIAFEKSENEDKTLWRKLAIGYLSRKTEGKPASIILYSPRRAGNNRQPSLNINKSLSELIEFHTSFIQSGSGALSVLPDFESFREVLEKLREASGLDENEFSTFFKSLKFELNAPEIEQIKQQLVNKSYQLGLEYTQINKLLDLVVNWSITGETINKEKILTGLGIKNRFADRLSHIFKVDDLLYVGSAD